MTTRQVKDVVTALTDWLADASINGVSIAPITFALEAVALHGHTKDLLLAACPFVQQLTCMCDAVVANVAASDWSRLVRILGDTMTPEAVNEALAAGQSKAQLAVDTLLAALELPERADVVDTNAQKTSASSLRAALRYACCAWELKVHCLAITLCAQSTADPARTSGV